MTCVTPRNYKKSLEYIDLHGRSDRAEERVVVQRCCGPVEVAVLYSRVSCEGGWVAILLSLRDMTHWRVHYRQHVGTAPNDRAGCSSQSRITSCAAFLDGVCVGTGGSPVRVFLRSPTSGNHRYY